MICVDRGLASIVIASVFLLAISGMFFGWRARSTKQANFAVLDRPPSDLGEIVATANGLYVATTLHDDALERVSVRGLGFRSRTALTVARGGVVVELTGQEPFFIARNLLHGARRATWTIDKAVEKGGLHMVTWMLGDREVDSYFRLDGDQEGFVGIVNGLVEVRK